MKKYFMHSQEISWADIQEKKRQKFMERVGQSLILMLGIVAGIYLSQFIF